MKMIYLAAVLAATALLFSAIPADAKKGTRSCAPDDQMVKLADGRLRCFEKGKALPKGATVVQQGQQRRAAARVATAPAPASRFAGGPAPPLPTFAEAAEGCLKEADALSTGPGVPGGFVGKDGQMHFTSPNDDLAAKCIAVGNAANRPQRWNQ